MPVSNFVCILFVATVALTPTASLGLTHQLTLKNGTGSHIIVDNQPNLEGESLGVITENCNVGVWTVYPGINYDWGVGGAIGVMYNLEEGCYPGYKKVNSARRVGVLSDAKLPSVTFYTEDNFRGVEFLIESHLPTVDFDILSVITIDTNIELFSEPNYAGESYCLDIPYCNKTVCWLFKYALSDAPFPPSLGKSIKLGCTLPPKPLHASSSHKHFTTTQGIAKQ